MTFSKRYRRFNGGTSPKDLPSVGDVVKDAADKDAPRGEEVEGEVFRSEGDDRPFNSFAIQPKLEDIDEPDPLMVAISKYDRANVPLRNEYAYQLRVRGYSYYQIGKLLGLDKKSAWRAVQKYKTHIDKLDLKQELSLELARLDYYLLMLQPKIQGGDVKAVTAAINAGKRRMELLGLEAYSEKYLQDRKDTTSELEQAILNQKMYIDPAKAKAIVAILEDIGASEKEEEELSDDGIEEAELV